MTSGDMSEEKNGQGQKVDRRSAETSSARPRRTGNVHIGVPCREFICVPAGARVLLMVRLPRARILAAPKSTSLMIPASEVSRTSVHQASIKG
jgi:hypothetical protein